MRGTRRRSSFYSHHKLSRSCTIGSFHLIRFLIRYSIIYPICFVTLSLIVGLLLLLVGFSEVRVFLLVYEVDFFPVLF